MIQKLHKKHLRFSYTRNLVLTAMSMFILNSTNATNWYVNDAFLTGDVFTTAIGNDANPGTPAAPFATVQFAINAAEVGDTIYVDAGSYVSADIMISKSRLVLRGAKFGIPAGPAANPAGRGTNETIILNTTVRYSPKKDSITVDGFTVDAGSLIQGIEARGLKTVVINNIVTGTITPFAQQAGIATRADAPNRRLSYFIANNNVQGFRFGVYMDGNIEDPSDIQFNYVSGCFTAAFVLTASNGHHFRGNVAENSGTGLLCQKGNNLIIENTFNANAINGIRIAGTNQAFGNSIMNNFITNNGTGINLTEDNAAASNNTANYNFIFPNVVNIASSHTANFNATCNWYGSTNPGIIAAQISGNVLFNPFLSDGIDTDPADGFQPITTCVVTPIVLLGFSATVKNYDVLLNWQTASEVNSDHFSIERSLDGSHFVNIGNVSAAGFSSNRKNYGFNDNKPVNFDKPTYYKIGMFDKDGTVKYTKVIPVLLKTNGSMVQQVYPNPAKAGTVLHTDFVSAKAQMVTISFINTTGQLIHKYEFQAFKGINQFSIPLAADVANGVNFLLIKSEDNVKQVPVFIR